MIDPSEPLAALRRTHPLPEGWSEPALVEDAILAAGVELYRVGLSTAAGAEEVNGAAATDGSPVARAYFELVERAVTLRAIRAARSACDLLTAEGAPSGQCGWADAFPESEEPSVWRYARSNGVAAHLDWQAACA